MTEKLQGVAVTADGLRGVHDHRPLTTQIADVLENRRLLAGLAALAAVGMVVLPVLLLPLLVAGGLIPALIVLMRPAVLPMRLPRDSGLRDPHDRKPGVFGGLFRARGDFLLGYEAGTRKQVWTGTEDILRHMLLLGVTGAGKTEALLGLVANALGVGGGCIYADAKATFKLLWQITALASLTGRIDDLLAINYITGGLSPGTGSEEAAQDTEDPLDREFARGIGRISNTAMPFAVGNADGILQIFVALMPAGGGGNEVFRERAIAIMGALLAGLVDLRNRFGRPISAHNIRALLGLAEFKKLVDGSYGQLSARARTQIEEYLRKIPGWKEGVPLAEQGNTVSEQFGYAQMYWTRPLGTLADSYGHIYGDAHAEVDFPDVVLNRRILVVLLPAMEKSLDDLGQIGKLNLASLKGTMALGLGFRLEGSREEVLESLPSASHIPTIGIFDEYGYMAAPGFAVAAAQARGLGFGAVFAGQGLAGFKVLNPTGGDVEVKQIIDNTRTKIAMAVEDASDTMDLFQKIGGQIDVTRESSYDINAVGQAVGTGSASLQKESRIHVMDIRRQIEGEAHVLWQHRLIRMIFFHANVTLPQTMRLNHGVAIRFERREDVQNGALGGTEGAATPSATDSAVLSPEDAHFVAALGQAGAPDRDPAEALLIAVAAWQRGTQGQQTGRSGGGPGAVPRPEPSAVIPDEGGEDQGPHFEEEDLAFLGQEGDGSELGAVDRKAGEPGGEESVPAEAGADGASAMGTTASGPPLDDLTRRSVNALADALGMESGLTPEVDQQMQERSTFREAYPADLDRPRGPDDDQDLDEIERRLREALQSHEAET